MSSKPQEFARRVLAAFDSAGHATDEEVGDAGGPSTTTLAKYRKVAAGEIDMTEPRNDVMRRIDRAAGWRGGSARALWREGREPAYVDPRPTGLSKALGGTPDTTPRKPERMVRVNNFESYVDWLAERLTEVEERLDLLDARLADELRLGSRADYDLAADEQAVPIDLASDEGDDHP